MCEKAKKGEEIIYILFHALLGLLGLWNFKVAKFEGGNRQIPKLLEILQNLVNKCEVKSIKF